MKKVLLSVSLFLLRIGMLAGIIFLLIHLGKYAYHFGYQIYSDKGYEASPGTDMAIVIYEDQSVDEIARMLERFGLIEDARVFKVQERLSRYHGEIVPGNYVLNTSYSGNRIIEILTGHEKEKEPSEEKTQ